MRRPVAGAPSKLRSYETWFTFRNKQRDRNENQKGNLAWTRPMALDLSWKVYVIVLVGSVWLDSNVLNLTIIMHFIYLFKPQLGAYTLLSDIYIVRWGGLSQHWRMNLIQFGFNSLLNKLHSCTVLASDMNLLSHFYCWVIVISISVLRSCHCQVVLKKRSCPQDYSQNTPIERQVCSHCPSDQLEMFCLIKLVQYARTGANVFNALKVDAVQHECILTWYLWNETASPDSTLPWEQTCWIVEKTPEGNSKWENFLGTQKLRHDGVIISS